MRHVAPTDTTRKLAVSASSERLLAAARSAVAELPAGSGGLVIAPTLGAARELLHSAVPEDGGLLDVHAGTLAAVAAEIAVAALAARGLAPVTGLGLEALVARAVARCRDRGELDHFDRVAGYPGYAPTLAATLEELRLWEVEAARLDELEAGGGDLARLAAAFGDSLERWSLADRAQVLALAAAAPSRHPHLGRPLLLLDLPLAHPAESALVERLARQAPWVRAFCLESDAPSRERLERILEVGAKELDAGAGARESRLERVRRWVFEARVPDARLAEDDDSVRFLSAPGEARESVEIARGIRDLAAEGVPFDRVAILLRDPESYLPVIEEALRRAALPMWASRGTVRPDPAGRAFLALLDCAAEDLSASRFAEFLSLGQVPLTDPAGAPPPREAEWTAADDPQLSFKFVERAGEGAPPAPPPLAPESHDAPAVAGTLRTPFQWERLLVDAAVVGGRGRWQRRLRGLGKELEKRIRHVGDEDEPRRRQLEDQLERLRHLEGFALPVVGYLDELPSRARWGEWLERLAGLAAMALRDPERVLALLAELRPMEEVGPVGLGEVRRVLERRLSMLRSPPPSSRYGRVFVGTLAEARGRSFHTVFVPGLAEGSFPRKAGEDPLLLDGSREALGAGLPTRRQRLADERLLLRVGAAAAQCRLVLSYPSLDLLQGRARVPSFYALDVLRAAEGRLPQLELLERRAVETSAAVMGWPGSRDPARAIDDAEFDLSVLEPLLGVDSGERGAARYLLEVSEPLARSLRWRGRRWRNFFSAADGLVDTDADTLAVLADHHPRARAYSPTSLQTYAACPYRFLLHGIHRLRPREEAAPLEQLDPLTRGSLFHEAQFELLGDLRAAGLLPVTGTALERVLELADRALDRVAERYAEELAPAIPRVWRLELDNLRIDFRGWLQQVASDDGDWRPARFEWAFGLPAAEGRDPASTESPAVVLDGYQLHGVVDLVEERVEGGALRVTDHKTGRARPERSLVVGSGEVLQPLLYALAAEALLDEPVECGRLFYCTRSGGYKSLPVRLGDYEKLQIGQVLEIVGEAVEEGFLPAAPREKACASCDYLAVCGRAEERRVSRKRPERLHRLHELRRLD